MIRFRSFGHWKASKTGMSLPPHTDAGLEFVFIANGAVRWDYEGTEVHVPAHHLSFTWPWQTHGARDARLPSVELYWVLIPLAGETSPGTEPRLCGGLGLSAAESRQLVRILLHSPPVIPAGARCGRHIAQLVNRLRSQHGRLDLTARGHLLLLLGEIRQSFERSALPTARVREGDHGLRAVRGFWETEVPRRIEHPWTLDEMAYACGLGRTSFAEKTKELHADTPMRKLTRMRVEMAASLLRKSRPGITEIALRCGFASSQHFATVFKEYTGHAPSRERSGSQRPG